MTSHVFSCNYIYVYGSLVLNARYLSYAYSWVVENSLDKLKFARQKTAYCYFSAAATLFAPELSDARMAWAKNGILTTVVDDFFDVGGSVEELLNLIQLVKKYLSVSTDMSIEHSFPCNFIKFSIL